MGWGNDAATAHAAGTRRGRTMRRAVCAPLRDGSRRLLTAPRGATSCTAAAVRLCAGAMASLGRLLRRLMRTTRHDGYDDCSSDPPMHHHHVRRVAPALLILLALVGVGLTTPPALVAAPFPGTLAWELRADLPGGVFGAAGGVVGGQLYVSHGFRGADSAL